VPRYRHQQRRRVATNRIRRLALLRRSECSTAVVPSRRLPAHRGLANGCAASDSAARAYRQRGCGSVIPWAS
jgi:hypothetical protein